MFDNSINQDVANYFDQTGAAYSNAWVPVAKQRLSSLELSLVNKSVDISQAANPGVALKALDIGVGNGRIGEVLLGRGLNYYGIDISQTMVDFCNKKFAGNSNLKQIIVHDIINPLPADWNNFNLVTAVRVLSYSSLWQDTLENIYQAMVKNGVLFFTFPNTYSTMWITKIFKRNKHVGTYQSVSYKQIVKLLQKIGFSDIQINGLNKLLDTLYDKCDSKWSAGLLFLVEKILRLILGGKFLTREFYIICKK